MFPPVKVLQWELHLLPALILFLYLLPYSSNTRVRYVGCYLVYILSVTLVSLLLLPVFLVTLRWKDCRNCLWASYFLKHVTRIIGIKWELRRGEVLREERGAVVVANHQSMFDILGMFNIWNTLGKCATVAKKELFYVWPFGLSAWVAGVIFIDRLNSKNAYKQLDDTSKIITEQKTKLWLFPEGTRNRSMDSLLPFKKGAFRVAINSQVPIIPVVYSPYHFINTEKKIFGRGRITITAIDPIPTKGLTEADIDSLMEKTWAVMNKQFQLSKQEALSFEDTGKTKG